ncbi:MAG: formylglycine-generating enzyme family protein [Planctomycetota bacterium]
MVPHPIDSAHLDPRVRDLPVLVLDDRPQGLRIRFRAIPAGSFVMGSRGFSSFEEPQHTVIIPPIPGRTDGVAFWLAETPVTQRQFRLWTKSRSYAAWRRQAWQDETHSNHFQDRDEAPAESVTWFEANGYCNWLSSRPWSSDSLALLADSPTHFGLPLEIEWEYACRAGSDTEYWSGDGEAALGDVGWFGREWESGTLLVGELPASGFGLFDMHGNVREWCFDPWEDEPYRDRLPIHEHHPAAIRQAIRQDEDSRRNRVTRGGAFDYSAWGCRSACRFWRGPGFRGGWMGFRVCLFPGPGVQPASPAKARSERARAGKARGEPDRAAARSDADSIESLRLPPRRRR